MLIREDTKETNQLAIPSEDTKFSHLAWLLAFDDDNEEDHVPFFAISPLREPRCLVALRHFAHHVDSSHFATSRSMLTHRRLLSRR